MSYKVLYSETLHSSSSMRLKGKVYLSTRGEKKQVFSGIEISIGNKNLVISEHNLDIIEENLDLLKQKVAELKQKDFSHMKGK